MALARSASGPGGLNINTNTANSIFTSQPPASGGIFGSSSLSKPAGGLFGASTTTTSAPQSQGLFGNPQTTTASSGGLFASLTSSTAPQTSNILGSVASSGGQTGGLFGMAPATTQPNQSSSLFGSLGTGAQPQQVGGLSGNASTTTQAQSTGIFGTQPAQSQGTSAGLFGTTMQTPQAGGLLGNIASQSQNKPSLSLGSLGTSQTSQPQGGNTFGFLNVPRPTFGSGLTGGLSMGQSQSHNQNQSTTQTIPGVRIDVSNIRGTTRFNELHDELQKEIENYDKGILIQQQRANDCSAILPSHGEQLSFVPEGVEFLSRKLVGVETSLETDAESVAFVQDLVKADIEDAKLSFKAIDNLKLPKQFHHSGVWSSKTPTLGPESQDPSAQDLVSFFSRTANDMDSKLSMYKDRITEIEQHLRSVENAAIVRTEHLAGNGIASNPGEQLRELGGVLREFEAGIMSVASVVAKTQDELEILKMGEFLMPEESHRGRTAHNKK